MLIFWLFQLGFGRLSSAVVLKVFEDRSGLFGREIRPHAHMKQDGLPLCGGPFSGVTLRVAPVAMHRIELSTAQFFRDSFRLFFG
jgi:hypothetical protein